MSKVTEQLKALPEPETLGEALVIINSLKKIIKLQDEHSDKLEEICRESLDTAKQVAQWRVNDIETFKRWQKESDDAYERLRKQRGGFFAWLLS